MLLESTLRKCSQDIGRQARLYQRSKIYSSILGSILSRIRGSRSNVNSILSANRRLNRKTKLDTRIVSKALYQLCTE